MGKLLNIVNPLHNRTKRNYVDRMVNEKVHCMGVAKEYGYDYWDGDRKYGYGGYSYDGRWKVVAEGLIEQNGLKDGCSILDVGCGKGYLLYELKQLLPNAKVVGFDVSEYGIEDAKPEIKDSLFIAKAEEKYDFADDEFDLVVSLGALHNLKIFDLKTALQEIERVGKNKYVMVESYRNDEELFNLQCWALTCQSFYSTDEWVWLYEEFGYSGDYEFIFFM